MPALKRTAWRACCTQYSGWVISPRLASSPVRLLTRASFGVA